MKLSGLFFKHVLAYAAERADEIIRQVLERNARCEIVIGISFCLIVNPAADCANPNFHGKSLLFAFGQTLSIEKLYAASVTKTRTKPDNIGKNNSNYLCDLRKNELKSKNNFCDASQFGMIWRSDCHKAVPDKRFCNGIRSGTPKPCTKMKKACRKGRL